jgi:hypothetical protein
MSDDPTRITYLALSDVYSFFNERLFGNRLPYCLITYQRHRSAAGFFAAKRFTTRDGTAFTDEIALNPAEFKTHKTEEILSTLAHEMTHLQQQHHFGHPSRSGYHNGEWAGLMLAIGLIPSDTGEPGGKQTGQSVSHYIEPGGPFDVASVELIKAGFDFRFVDDIPELAPTGADDGEVENAPDRQPASKNKTGYICPTCGLLAWAKPSVNLVCGDCNERMSERR